MKTAFKISRSDVTMIGFGPSKYLKYGNQRHNVEINNKGPCIGLSVALSEAHTFTFNAS
jgi:hypothetical protein